MKNINDYPYQLADCYEIANWLNNSEKFGHPKYNNSANAALAAQLMREAGWTFLTYNEYGEEVWQKKETE